MRALIQVTVWEFMRIFKWKQELVGLLVGLLLGGLITAGSTLVTRMKAKDQTHVALVNPTNLPLLEAPGIRFEPTQDLQAAADQVAQGAKDALLTIMGPDRMHLLVAKDLTRQKELERVLLEARRSLHLHSLGIDAAAWSDLNRGPLLEVTRTASARPAIGPARKIAGIALLVFQTMAVMTCFGLFFTNLTGEKQQRVTEQVVTAISPQTWMDGKILAFSLHGLKGVLSLAFWGLLAGVAAMRLSGSSFLRDLGAISPLAWVAALSFLFLGLLFWSAFNAGLAATIDDPNHSARTSVMLLPVLPTVFSFMLMKHPDMLLSKVMSWLPLTSMGMMPLRVVQGSAGPLEALGSALLLLASFLVLRRFAGRIFRTSMLLYGQEPSWTHILRMMRRA